MIKKLKHLHDNDTGYLVLYCKNCAILLYTMWQHSMVQNFYIHVTPFNGGILLYTMWQHSMVQNFYIQCDTIQWCNTSIYNVKPFNGAILLHICDTYKSAMLPSQVGHWSLGNTSIFWFYTIYMLFGIFVYRSVLWYECELGIQDSSFST
jgi:hypothetical protein